MAHTLVVFDSETDYTEQLSRMLGSQRTLPFEIHAFTELNALTAFLTRRRASLLLVAEKDYSDAVPADRADMVLILREEIGSRALTSYKSVKKYQSSADLVREIMTYYMPAAAAQTAAALDSRTEIIGIFSPLGRCGRTLFASACGMLLADRGPVLFISLDPFCGIDALRPAAGLTLSDLLYYAKEDDAQLLARIKEAERTLRLLTFIPPVRTPQDIYDMDTDDFHRLLTVIARYRSYETILLDFGPAVPSPIALLAFCRRLYMPVLSDSISKGKLEEFRAVLRLSGRGDLIASAKEITVPPYTVQYTGDGFADELLLSPVGMQAMRLMKEER